jgi:hypothetical protein
MPTSAHGTLASLRKVMVKDGDAIGVTGLAAIEAAAARGHLDEAAHVAELVAEPLPAKRAAMIVRLPGQLLAVVRLRRALEILATGDTMAAFALAVEARTIDGQVAPSVYDRVRAARIEGLRQRAQAEAAAGRPVSARAYWLAADALGGSNDATRRGLEATEKAAVDAVRVRLALAPSGGVDVRERFGALLEKALPRHVSVVADGPSAGATLAYVMSETRTHHASKSSRSKTVTAGTIIKPNPAYAEAQSDLAAAREEHAQAMIQAQEFRQKAAEYAAQGGVAGTVSATAANATAIGLIASANKRVSDASSKLAATPKTISEKVEATAMYPVVALETTVKLRFVSRLDGLGDVINDSFERSADRRVEQVDAAPSLGLAETRADVESLAGFTPDYADALAQVATRIGDRVRDHEEASGWHAFTAARTKGDLWRAVWAAVGYLAVARENAPHRTELLEFLARSLP